MILYFLKNTARQRLLFDKNKSAGALGYKVERKTAFNLEYVNSAPRFTGRLLDMQAYPLDLLLNKNEKSFYSFLGAFGFGFSFISSLARHTQHKSMIIARGNAATMEQV